MAAYINPNTFWQLSFIGFAFPVVLLLNVAFLIGWTVVRSRSAFVSLIAIVLCLKFIFSSFAFNFFSEQKEEGVKVMSWNVKNFDLYNWSGNEETRELMM